MRTSVVGYGNVDVFIGVDVGNGELHAAAVSRDGRRLLDKAQPNDESKLRELIRSLRQHGTILFCCGSAGDHRRSAAGGRTERRHSGWLSAEAGDASHR